MMNEADNGGAAAVVDAPRSMNGRLHFEDDGGSVERFAGDDRPIPADEDRMISRMLQPRQVLDRLAKIGSGRFDLMVPSADTINFVADPASPSGVSIAPTMNRAIADESDNGGAFVSALETRGSIPVTLAAMNQMAKLLDKSGGWSSYQKMNAPVSHFLRDVRGRFGNNTGEAQFVARTNGSGDNYQVEAFMPATIDRTDSSVIVAQAMRGIMERYGDMIRGVEMLHHGGGGGANYRILFGDPLIEEREADPFMRLYTMLDLSLSDSRRFHPSASIGLWRMWCLNGCLMQDAGFASFKADASTTGAQLVNNINGLIDVAAPMAGAVAGQLTSLQTTPLEMKPSAVVNGIHARNLIGEKQRDDLLQSIEAGGGDGSGVETEWDMFNTFTDAAKRSGTLQSRMKAEGRGLMFAMADGGFSGVAQHGFDRSAFRSRVDRLYQTHVGNPNETGLGRVKALGSNN